MHWFGSWQCVGIFRDPTDSLEKWSDLQVLFFKVFIHLLVSCSISICAAHAQFRQHAVLGSKTVLKSPGLQAIEEVKQFIWKPSKNGGNALHMDWILILPAHPWATPLNSMSCRVRAYGRKKNHRISITLWRLLEVSLTLTLLLLTSFLLVIQSLSEALPTCARDGFSAK